MIYVYTAIAGGFDNLRPPLLPLIPTEPTRFICFTDNPLQEACPPWEFRPLPSVGHAARSTRGPKILPHLFLPEDCAWSIWHDANFQLKEDPAAIVKQVQDAKCQWMAHKHPARDCIYKEAGILLSENIGTRSLVEAEVELYRKAKHPERFGLWANGFIVRSHAGGTMVRRVCETWWRLYTDGCERDQLSFPVALRIHCAEGMVLSSTADVFRSPFVKFNWHAPWIDKDDNPSHHPARRLMGERLRQLRQVTGIQVTYWGEND